MSYKFIFSAGVPPFDVCPECFHFAPRISRYLGCSKCKVRIVHHSNPRGPVRGVSFEGPPNALE